MLPIQNFSSSVLAGIIRRQPASQARTTFAWRIVVGPALARVTTVELKADVLEVRSKDLRWMKEIERARPAVLAKMQHLLGPDAVRVVKTRH